MWSNKMMNLFFLSRVLYYKKDSVEQIPFSEHLEWRYCNFQEQRFPNSYKADDNAIALPSQRTHISSIPTLIFKGEADICQYREISVYHPDLKHSWIDNKRPKGFNGHLSIRLYTEFWSEGPLVTLGPVPNIPSYKGIIKVDYQQYSVYSAHMWLDNC